MEATVWFRGQWEYLCPGGLDYVAADTVRLRQHCRLHQPWGVDVTDGHLRILFGAFTTIVALNESGMSLSDVDFFLKATIVVVTLLTAFGVIAVFVAYQEPGVMVAVSEICIVPLPPVSAEELGYTPEQGMQFLRLGSLWMSLANILYLVTVIGGYLLVTIRRAAP